nr:MAG TPA: hypothetical protein [Crassvirales sp.]
MVILIFHVDFMNYIRFLAVKHIILVFNLILLLTFKFVVK